MNTVLRKLLYGFSMSVFCMALAGCGDGTLEIKSKSNGSTPIIVEKQVIIEKPSPTRETTRTETTTPSGQTTKTETKTISR